MKIRIKRRNGILSGLLAASLVAGIFGAGIVGSASPLSAQPMKKWTWKKHKIRFKLPKTWKIKKNNAGIFLAKGPHDVTIKIKPLGRRFRAAQSAAKFGFKTYVVIRNRKILKKKYLKSAGTGLMRYIMFGVGLSNRSRKPVNFGIIGLKHLKSKHTLYVRFWWFKKDGKMFNRLTYKIAKSFRAMN